MEFGEKVHYKKNTKGHKDNKLDIKWGEGYFLGFYWKTSEAPSQMPACLRPRLRAPP